MREILIVAFAGALGSVGRYGLSGWAHRRWGVGFAYGTLSVNVLGCFALAFVMYAALSSELLPRHLRLAVTTGFLGAFTTFSTFGYETVHFATKGEWKLAALNVAANVVLGLAAATAGWGGARLLFGR